MSETAKARNRLEKYCLGNGLDCGFGGDAINKTAIRMDMPTPYGIPVGSQTVQLGGDANNLYWFKDNVLDYIFSSHLLEDFPETKPILIEWLRVLKTGGRLILYLPNEKKFFAHCQKTGQAWNHNHKQPDFSLKFIQDIFNELKITKEIYSKDECEDYSFEIVIEKL